MKLTTSQGKSYGKQFGNDLIIVRMPDLPIQTILTNESGF